MAPTPADARLRRVVGGGLSQVECGGACPEVLRTEKTHCSVTLRGMAKLPDSI